MTSFATTTDGHSAAIGPKGHGATRVDEFRELVQAAESHDHVRRFARTLTDPDDLALLEMVVADLVGNAPTAPGPVIQYHDAPAAFARDVIDWPEGKRLAVYQAEILQDLVTHGREAVRGPHGLGKTSDASFAVLWFALTRDEAGEDWKVPITASAWLQLTHFLWPEIHKWAGRIRWDAIGRAPFTRYELLKLNLQLRYGEAFSASPSEAGRIEGAHASQLLYVFDEAKLIPDPIWDAVEGAFSTAGPDTTDRAYALAISTPGEPQGRFYDIHSRKAGYGDWNVRHVRKEEAVEAGRISEQWIADRAAQWGTTTAMYQNRVEGEFASSDTDGVIPLAWVEAAQQRWREMFPDGWVPPGDLTAVGVDCSGMGADRTVIARRYGSVIGPLERPRKRGDAETGDEEMATAGRVVGILESAKSARAIIDGVGDGAPVVGRVREQVDRKRVHAFIAGAKSKRKDRTGEMGFADLRSQAWWNLREMLDPNTEGELALPPDDDLTGDLTAPHWREASGGKIRVESKDDIKKRLGRSTDSGDAVVMVCDRPVTYKASVESPMGSMPSVTPGSFARSGH